MPRLALLLLALATLLAPACDQKQAAKSSKKEAKESSTKTGTKTGSGTGTGTPTETPDCAMPGSTTEGNAGEAEGGGEEGGEEAGDEDLGLALAGVYYADVKGIIEKKCQACHPSYGDYKGAKAEAELSLATIKDGSMPKGMTMTAAEKKTFEDWVKGGALEKASTDGSGDGAGDSSGDGAGDSSGDGSSGDEPVSSDPCPPASTDDGETDEGETDEGEFKADPDLFKDILNPPAREACKAEKGCWFRKATTENPHGYCYKNASGQKATCPATTFSCDRAGVLKAFNNSSDAKSRLDEKDAAGWTYDECGTINGKPIVFFACYHNGDGKCVKSGSVIGDTLSIKAETLSAQ